MLSLGNWQKPVKMMCVTDTKNIKVIKGDFQVINLEIMLQNGRKPQNTVEFTPNPIPEFFT